MNLFPWGLKTLRSEEMQGIYLWQSSIRRALEALQIDRTRVDHMHFFGTSVDVTDAQPASAPRASHGANSSVCRDRRVKVSVAGSLEGISLYNKLGIYESRDFDRETEIRRRQRSRRDHRRQRGFHRGLRESGSREDQKVATWTGLLQHGVKHCHDIGVANDEVVAVLNFQSDPARRIS